MRKLFGVVAALGLVAVGAGAQTVLYNGNATSGADANVWGMSGPGYEDAAYFRTPYDASLSSARIGISYQGPPTTDANPGFLGEFDWKIYTTNAGHPSSVLASGTSVPTFTYTNQEAASYGLTQGYASFGLPNVLVSGMTDYWLSVTNTDPAGVTTASHLLWSALGGTVASQQGRNGEWTPLPAIDDIGANYGNRLSVDILGSSVPEPSSIALLGTGLMGLVPFTRRRFRPRR